MEIVYAVCADLQEHSHEKDILHFPQITAQNLQAQIVFPTVHTGQKCQFNLEYYNYYKHRGLRDGNI